MKSFKAYTGSKSKFQKFELSKIGSNINTDKFDLNGIFFSPSKPFALQYATGETCSSYTGKDGKTIEKKTPASDGYLYVCTISPKNELVIDSQREYDKYVKNKDLLKNYDLVIHTNIKYTKPNSNEEVDENGIEYVVLDPSIIKIERIEHYSKENKLLEVTNVSKNDQG